METSVRTPRASNSLEIEYLFLDLSSCTRCRETDQNLEQAIDMLIPRLASQGVTVSLRKVLVESAEQAIHERLVTSPTVRVNGRDIAQIEETPCESCTDLCACGDGTFCRVWSYDGEKHSAAPVDLLIEAITKAALEAVDAGTPPDRSGRFELPDNLKRFFAGKDAKKKGRVADEGKSPCCEPSRCDCGGTCDCGELESASCGCHS